MICDQPRLSIVLSLAALFLIAMAGPDSASALPFRNLDFELAGSEFSSLPVWAVGAVAGSDPPNSGDVPFGPVAVTERFFNGVCLGSKCVHVQNSETPFEFLRPLEGEYSLLLQGGTFSGGSVFVEQSGDVPIDARSVRLHADTSGGRLSDLRLLANGITLAPAVEVSRLTRGSLLAVDISAFAGQTILLRIAVASNFAPPDYIESNILIDSIGFSTRAVPEPTAIVLVAMGLAILAARPMTTSDER